MASLSSIPYSVFNRDKLVIYFFIGRMNPPHAGHEALLGQMMANAAHEHSIPLILLGSGPNGGERTLDDPLSFPVKSRVLQYRLSGSLCEIREKGPRPVDDVVDWANEIMHNIGQVRSIEFKLVVGDKDGNATKLDFLHGSITKRMNALGIECRSHTIAVRPESNAGGEMSATRIRKDALRSLLAGDHSFHAKYGGYYGPQLDNVFGQIAEIASTLSEDILTHYIETGDLPKKKSAKASAKGSKKKKGAMENE